MVDVASAVRTAHARLGGMAASGLGRQSRRLGAQRRRGMHRPSPRTLSRDRAETTGTSRSAWSTGTTHQRLAGPDRTCINRPPGNWTGRAIRRHARTVRGRCAGHGRFRQPRNHIRPRRNDGPRRRLSREIRFGGRAQGTASADGRRGSGSERRGGRHRPHRGRSRSRRRNTRNAHGRHHRRRSRARRAGRRRSFRQFAEIRRKTRLAWRGTSKEPAYRRVARAAGPASPERPIRASRSAWMARPVFPSRAPSKWVPNASEPPGPVRSQTGRQAADAVDATAVPGLGHLRGLPWVVPGQRVLRQFSIRSFQPTRVLPRAAGVAPRPLARTGLRSLQRLELWNPSPPSPNVEYAPPATRWRI